MPDIAGRWFERRPLAGGVTWLWEPHVHPLLRCNIWHVRGRDRDLLVDTGLGVSSLRASIADLNDKPLDAVATHIHYDHVGSLHEFENRLMHEAEAGQMNPYLDSSAEFRYTSGLRGSPAGGRSYDEVRAGALPAPRPSPRAINTSAPPRT